MMLVIALVSPKVEKNRLELKRSKGKENTNSKNKESYKLRKSLITKLK